MHLQYYKCHWFHVKYYWNFRIMKFGVNHLKANLVELSLVIVGEKDFNMSLNHFFIQIAIHPSETLRNSYC